MQSEPESRVFGDLFGNQVESRGVGQLGAREQRGFVSPRSSSGMSSEDSGGEYSDGLAHPGKRRRNWWVKSRRMNYTYALGEEDIDWNEVAQMAEQSLVGKALGRSFSLRNIVAWAEAHWRVHIGYVPEVVGLYRNWFAFTFLKAEHALWVLNRNWNWDHCPVMLKPWHPLFDATRERFDTAPFWVRLPGLPLDYWSEEHFRGIGNILGSYLGGDYSFVYTKEKKVARILVNLNVREGLAEDMKLSWGPYAIMQKLEYENVPFRCWRWCWRCHAYGHPASDCKLPLRTRNGGRRKWFDGIDKSVPAGPSSSTGDQPTQEGSGAEQGVGQAPEEERLPILTEESPAEPTELLRVQGPQFAGRTTTKRQTKPQRGVCNSLWGFGR